MALVPDLALLANGDGAMSAPFHPMLVNFTAALVPVSFCFDLFGVLLRKEQLRAVGWWTLLSAAGVTPFTALAGWLWMRSMDHADHGLMTVHQWLGISLAIVIVALAAWRGWLQWRAAKPGWEYAAAALIIFSGLVYQGELGASMSFGRGIVVSSGQDHGHEESDDTHDNGSPPTERPAQTQPQDHEHGKAAQWRDHIDLKE